MPNRNDIAIIDTRRSLTRARSCKTWSRRKRVKVRGAVRAQTLYKLGLYFLLHHCSSYPQDDSRWAARWTDSDRVICRPASGQGSDGLASVKRRCRDGLAILARQKTSFMKISTTIIVLNDVAKNVGCHCAGCLCTGRCSLSAE